MAVSSSAVNIGIISNIVRRFEYFQTQRFGDVRRGVSEKELLDYIRIRSLPRLYSVGDKAIKQRGAGGRNRSTRRTRSSTLPDLGSNLGRRSKMLLS
jgi:hypothetical protein